MLQIRVYRADLGHLRAEICHSLLSEEERRQASRLANRAARHEFVTTRALLRQLLAMHTGEPAGALEFASGPCGKPMLKGAQGGMHFNVSHSHGMAMVAIGPAEVGIDIERIDKGVDCDAVAASVFSNSEIGVMRSATAARRAEAFFSIWTRKEAYLKATGLGFSSDLVAISTTSPRGAIEDLGAASAHQDWHVFDLPAPAGFKAALVTTRGQCQIEIVDVTAAAPLELRGSAGISAWHRPARPDGARGHGVGAR